MTDTPTNSPASLSPATPYRHVLFCTDFSRNADLAFTYAVEAVRPRPGCSLHLLHVIPEPEAQFWKTYIYEVDGVDTKARHDIDEKIAQTYQPLVPEGMPFDITVRIGNPYEQILAVASEKETDLIVLGRQGHSTLGKMLFGGVTEKVVRHAHCPVLVVPRDFVTGGKK